MQRRVRESRVIMANELGIHSIYLFVVHLTTLSVDQTMKRRTLC
jgi:hypothetical protein